MRETAAVCMLMAGLAGGCANVPREAGFGVVQATVADRTGGMRVHWNQGTDADAAVAEDVRQMLSRGELSPDEAVQIALLNNRQLQATYEDLMVAQADVVAAGLLSNPIFEAEVTFAEAGGGTGYEFAIVQEFLSVFQIPLRKRIAGSRFEAAKLRVSGAAIDLAADVREAHVQLVAAQQMAQMRQTVLDAAEASYELAQRIRDAGNITARTLVIERVQYEQAKLDVAAAEYEVVARRERLNVLMGLSGEPAAGWEVPARLPEPAAEMADAAQTVDELERRAIENSLDLAVMRHEIRGSGRVLGLERTHGLLPDLAVGAKAEREADGDWAAGPVLELPIPLFSQGQPQIAAAAAELRRSRARFQASAVQLRSAVRAAHALEQNAGVRVRHFQETMLPLRAAIVEQTQLEYNAMIAGPFELLEARRQQIEAGGQYIDALREYWTARNALETLLNGRMRAVDLEASAPRRSSADEREH